MCSGVCLQAGQIGAADATLSAGVLCVELDLVHLVVVLIQKSFLLDHSITMFAGKRLFISILGLLGNFPNGQFRIVCMELSDVILHGCQLPLPELASCALVAVLLQDV